MNLRPATSTDLDLLRLWDEQTHVIASDPNDDWHWEVELDRDLDWREQLIAEIDGGTAQKSCSLPLLDVLPPLP